MRIHAITSLVLHGPERDTLFDEFYQGDILRCVLEPIGETYLTRVAGCFASLVKAASFTLWFVIPSSAPHPSDGHVGRTATDA